ncbi:MAG: hypothetical protein RMJ39_09465 [Deltaproteobacteria bacterium]|nr:hypothetical protein [Deltaproteobacteria bacterium]
MVYDPYNPTLIPSVAEPLEKLRISGEHETRRRMIRRRRKENQKVPAEELGDERTVKEPLRPDSTIEITV